MNSLLGKSKYSKIFENQEWHLLAAFIVIVFFYFLIPTSIELTKGSLFDIDTYIWLWVAILTPIIHQLYVFTIWRYELYMQVFTKNFGLEKSFKVYSVGFAILFVFRLISIIFLAFSNKNTLGINPIYAYTIAIIITPFIIYLFYSVKKYFTIKRAYGIDHFDKNYNVAYVKKGIFKYTDNGMYVVGLSVLYLPGLLLLSKAALVVALLNHLYIWVHYYSVEKPDMKYIYGKST